MSQTTHPFIEKILWTLYRFWLGYKEGYVCQLSLQLPSELEA
jgi:hypothetical protein